jgi:hypothetical protein
MAVNEVIYGGETLISLKGDTVTASDMARGATAHNAAGEVITGLATKIEIKNLSDVRERTNKPTYDL